MSTSLPETLSRTGSLDLPGIIDAAVADGRSYRKISSCLDEAMVDGEIRGRNEVARMVIRYLLQYHPVP